MSSQINLLEQRPHPFRSFAKNLTGGLRSIAFLRIDQASFIVSWGQLIALSLISLTPTLLHNLITFGLKGSFVFYSLPTALFLVPLALVTAWAITYRVRQPNHTLLLMIAFISITFQIEMIDTLYDLATQYWRFPKIGKYWSQVIYYLPYVWLSLAATVTAIRLLSIRPLHRIYAITCVAVLLAWPLATLWQHYTLWIPPYNEEAEAPRISTISENAFYQQPKLLKQQLSAIQPSRKGIIDLYFVGAAGYARQDVFMREILSINKLFEERFDTKGRAIKLINNPKTLYNAPIASSTSIEAALKRVGQVMNREEDILFLFLTSHGSKETGFSLNFWPFRFHLLEPEKLRHILNKSGIKNRVIVISACYSGMYVTPLKNENTLIITAAAADKTSFGCEDKADFTYFDKAYFDEALRDTYSFTEAFELAKPKIQAREEQQGYESSNPQIFIGEKIKPILAKFTNQFRK